MNLTELTAAIDAKTAKIGIVGLGYVGLPLVRAFVEAGYTTIGFDVDCDCGFEGAPGRLLFEVFANEPEFIVMYDGYAKSSRHLLLVHNLYYAYVKS